jgi:hypothetical protein
MADVTKNPPKEEISPGQSLDSRKSGPGNNKKVIDELQEFNSKTESIGQNAKDGFRAIVDGIKQGNKDMNPEEAQKTRVTGFKDLTDAQQNVIDIFTKMSESSEQARTVMAKETSLDKLESMENTREEVGLWERMLLRLVGIDEDLDKLIQNTAPREEDKGWLGKIFTGLILGAVTGFVAGMVFGFGEVLLLYGKLLVKGVRFIGGKFVNSKFMAPIINPIKAFFLNIRTGIQTQIARVGNLLKPITNTFKNIRTQFLHGLFGKKGGVAGLKGIKGMGSTSNVFTQLGVFFGRIKAWTKGVGGPVKQFNTATMNLAKNVKIFGSTAKSASSLSVMFGGAFKSIKSFFGIFRVVFNPIWAGFRAAFTVFAKFGRVLGRFFLPLTIIMGLIDGVKGFIDGFKNTKGGLFKKIVGGLIGGVKGIVNGLIMMPLDMLKSAVAWILGKFGFDGLAESLKSFSFQEMFSNLVDMFTNTLWAIVDWFKLLFSDPMSALKSLASGFAGMMKKFYQAIVRMILPDPQGNGAWYNPMNLIAKAIPSSIYEWAGLDPDTGERIPEPEEIQKELVPTPDSQSTLGKVIFGDKQKEDAIKKLAIDKANAAKDKANIIITKLGDTANSVIETTIIGTDAGGTQTASAIRE